MRALGDVLFFILCFNLYLLFVSRLFSDYALAQTNNQSNANTQAIEIQGQSIVIDGLKASGLVPLEEEYLEKIIIRTLAKQQKFHLVIRDKIASQKLKKLQSVQVEIKQVDKDRFYLAAMIQDLATSKLIKKVTAKKVSSDELNRKTEILIEILFDIQKKTDPKEKIKTIPVAQVTKIPKNVKKPSQKSPPPSVVNLRERILSIKSNIKAEFIKQEKQHLEIIDKEDAKESKDNEKKQDKKKPNESVEEFSIELPPVKDLAQEGRKVFAENKYYRFSYGLEAGALFLTTESVNRKDTYAEVSLTDTLNFYTLGFSINLRLKALNFLETYINYNNLRSIFLSDDYELAPLNHLTIGLKSNWIYSKYQLKILNLTEQVPFASIPDVGKGIFISVYDVSYVGVSLTYRINNKVNMGFNLYNYLDSKALKKAPTQKLSHANKTQLFLNYNTNYLFKNSLIRLSYHYQQFEARDQDDLLFSFNQNVMQASALFTF